LGAATAHCVIAAFGRKPRLENPGHFAALCRVAVTLRLRWQRIGRLVKNIPENDFGTV
jgi:hypothetical protein